MERPGAPGVVYDELVYDRPLRTRLEEALYRADLFGVTAAPTPERIAGLVMHELGLLADDLDELGREHYFAHRHTGPIEHAAGVEDTLGWLADLLRGIDRPLPHEDWTK